MPHAEYCSALEVSITAETRTAMPDAIPMAAESWAKDVPKPMFEERSMFDTSLKPYALVGKTLVDPLTIPPINMRSPAINEITYAWPLSWEDIRTPR